MLDSSLCRGHGFDKISMSVSPVETGYCGKKIVLHGYFSWSSKSKEMKLTLRERI